MGTKDRNYVDIMSVHPGVTGSCNLEIVKLPNGTKIKFIVDCGLFQEREYSSKNEKFKFVPENIDFCIVTHNHVDHIGRLPLLVKQGFSNPIYTTQTTAKLIPYALDDSYRVLKDVSKRQNQPPLYGENDVLQTIKLLHPCPFEETIEVNENIKITFFMNGHLMGAAMVLVQIVYPGCNDINLLFTGDYNNKNMFLDIRPLPQWVLDLPLTVIQESTYGDMDSTQVKKCFRKNILECLDNGGTVIAPVFSLGRSQEILYELKCMQDDGSLDVNIPIYFDGSLAIRYTRLYLNDGLDIKEDMRDFMPKNLTYVDRSNRCEVVLSQETKIVLTTSGMGSYGPAQVYIPEYLTRRNSLIHFTGYTTPGTLGARLKEAKIGDLVQVGGTLVRRMARVEHTSEYSAHAKADEMIAFLKQFKNLNLVLVNHGEPSIKERFAERIAREVDAKRVGILGVGYFFRVNPYGLVKTLSTKFE